MKAVVGLLIVLLEVSHAAETYCDARQKGAQCYGALGGTVAFKLMDETSEKHRFSLKKEASMTNESNQIILSVRSNVITSNTMSSRSVFILNNGTFKINNLSRSDGGKYTLEIFDSTGKRKENRTLQLHVQARVSSVRMISECVAQLLKVSCLSEGGDSPQYSWFLNGQPTGDTEIVNRNPVNNIIILKQNMSGYLTCSVWNKISRVSEERRMSLCKDKTHETQCSIQEDKAKCYGALGGAVVIQLMNNTSQTPKYEWKNKTSTILRGRRNNFAPNDMEGRNIFIPLYGTFSIMNLCRADSGSYTLETFDSDGRKIEDRNLQLIVEAPVSSIKLVPECLSQGQMKVSCQPDAGDSLQYNWTLDGRTLTDSELFSGSNETDVIVLRQNISGRLVCSVWNRISSLSTEKTISTCGYIFINCTYNETQISEWVLAEGNTLCVDAVAYGVEDMLGVLASVFLALLFLLAVGIGFICAHKKKHTFQVEKDNSEPIYAEVRIVAQQERQTEESVEEEVEVKQETLSELPQQSEVAAVAPIYAQVRKVR
ncbi:contactin-4-like [Poecilia latipinna]|uniref:contactin-4-like n=1 Tax=Poecilia latipinna TaxID=48699 RepID=UPI00072E61C1|nr:PREDICTED: contactin-4-like [Poecilia latipinna]